MTVAWLHSKMLLTITNFLILLLSQFVKNLSNLKPIQVNADGTASFELDMDLIEQSRSIYLYKVSASHSKTGRESSIKSK